MIMIICALPWSGWHAFVPSSLTLTHFVHPCAAVKAISSTHKTCGRVHPNVHIEPCEGVQELRNTVAD